MKAMSPDETKARSELVESCRGTVACLRRVLAIEDDHIMQHALTGLCGELQWCISEFGGEGSGEN